jgi:hypothetical protein
VAQDPEGSSPQSKQPATGPYLEAVEASPYCHKKKSHHYKVQLIHAI